MTRAVGLFKMLTRFLELNFSLLREIWLVSFTVDENLPTVEAERWCSSFFVSFSWRLLWLFVT